MIAIHLGAAESQVAVMVGRSPRVIPNLEGHRATPTIVGFNEAGGAYVGEAARLLSACEDSPGASFLLSACSGASWTPGRRGRPDDGRGARLGAAANGDLRVIVGDDALSPPEIAAHLFAT
jgi:molecular chaperone DnaK (HSP70)